MLQSKRKVLLSVYLIVSRPANTESSQLCNDMRTLSLCRTGFDAVDWHARSKGCENCMQQQKQTTSDHAGLARSIGPHAAALVELVKDPPPDSEKLLLQMLTVLTGKTIHATPFHFVLPHACVVAECGMSVRVFDYLLLCLWPRQCSPHDHPAALPSAVNLHAAS